jgi:hypothetical protein
MGEIERDRNAGGIVRAEPFVRHPGVRPDPKPSLRELVVEVFQAPLEPGTDDGDLEVLET